MLGRKERTDSAANGVPLVERQRTGTKHSLFNLSFSKNTSASMSSFTEAGNISKIDAARVNAPFIMGSAIQQSVQTICINKNGEKTEKSVRI